MWSDIPTAILSQINARFIECNVESLHRLHIQCKLNSVYDIGNASTLKPDKNLKFLNGFLVENRRKF